VKLVLGALAGLGCVMIVIACGGRAAKGSMPQASPPQPIGAHGGTRARIDELDREIDGQLARMSLTRPGVSPGVCVQPPCGAEALASPGQPTAAPSCRPGPSERCKESCELADSICGNSAKICELATLLGGADAYANDRCASGKAACATAGQACCGCQL
jgi:hypothetical protein